MGNEQSAIAQRSNEIYHLQGTDNNEDVDPSAATLPSAVEAGQNAASNHEEKESGSQEMDIRLDPVVSAENTALDAQSENLDIDGEAPVKAGQEGVSTSIAQAGQQEDRTSRQQTIYQRNPLYDDIWAELCSRHPRTWADGEVPPGFLVRLSASIAASAEPTIWDSVKFPRAEGGMEIGDGDRPLQQPVWNIPDHLLEQVGHMVLEEGEEFRRRHNIPAAVIWPPTMHELEADAHELQQFWLRVFAGSTLPESVQLPANVRLLGPTYAPYSKEHSPGNFVPFAHIPPPAPYLHNPDGKPLAPFHTVYLPVYPQVVYYPYAPGQSSLVYAPWATTPLHEFYSTAHTPVAEPEQLEEEETVDEEEHEESEEARLLA